MTVRKLIDLLEMRSATYIVPAESLMAGRDYKALLESRAGGVVRYGTHRPTLVEFSESVPEVLGCIAGWVSEDEVA